MQEKGGVSIRPCIDSTGHYRPKVCSDVLTVVEEVGEDEETTFLKCMCNKIKLFVPKVSC